jgi:hypoxanthine phosphoribosyltransferase
MALFESKMPVHVANDFCYPLDNFFVPDHISETIGSILIPHGILQDRIEKLAADILKEHAGHTVHFLCVLKGGSRFCHDLWKYYEKLFSYARGSTHTPIIVDFIRIQSYENTGSTGNIKIDDFNMDTFAGKHVVVVEGMLKLIFYYTYLYIVAFENMS